jgi:PAS domain S-box-containing protein
MFSAWFGGVRPGLLATALCILAFNYYFVAPIHSLAVETREIPRLIIFALSAIFVGALSAAQRRAAESLRQARNDLQGTVQDLTRTNAALRESESRFRTMAAELQRSEAFLAEGQRISHTGSWGWHIPTGKLVWSDEHYRIFGFEPEQVEPTFNLFLERLHSEDRPVVRQMLDNAIRGRSDFKMEFRIALPNGAVKHVQGVGRPVVKESGDIDEYIGTTVDIAARKRVEEELRERANLLDLTHDTVFSRDMRDVITFWNRGAEKQ